MKIVSTTVNSIRKAHEPKPFVELNEQIDDLSAADLVLAIKTLLENNIEKKYIKSNVLPKMGYAIDTLPDEVLRMLG